MYFEFDQGPLYGDCINRPWRGFFQSPWQWVRHKIFGISPVVVEIGNREFGVFADSFESACAAAVRYDSAIKERRRWLRDYSHRAITGEKSQ